MQARGRPAPRRHPARWLGSISLPGRYGAAAIRQPRRPPTILEPLPEPHPELSHEPEREGEDQHQMRACLRPFAMKISVTSLIPNRTNVVHYSEVMGDLKQFLK